MIAIRLTPLVFIDDIRDRYPAYRPETTHRIPDWQERIRVHVRRQPESTAERRSHRRMVEFAPDSLQEGRVRSEPVSEKVNSGRFWTVISWFWR